MAALSKFDLLVEQVVERKVDRKIEEYFASLLELEKGPVVQVHAAVTRNGLTKAVRRTKRSQLADMKRGVEYKFKAPRGVTVARFADRWAKSAHSMKKKTGLVWSVHRNHDEGGVIVVRTR